MARIPSDPDVLTTDQLADRLGMAPDTISRLARAGRLPGFRAGRDWRFYWPAVTAALARGDVAEHEPPESGDDSETQT